MQKLRKGDEVIVIAGRDKGKRGTIALGILRRIFCYRHGEHGVRGQARAPPPPPLSVQSRKWRAA